ncbi:tetratricopeptide (TPR) repeat protein [Oxalobacteraceae bacterium GrIS 2.11]
MTTEQSRLTSLVKQGLHLHQSGKLAEAQTIYTQILAVQPNHFDALQLLGTLSNQMKRYHQALEFLSKAIIVNSSHALTYYNRGIAFKELNRLEDAIADYDKAIRLKPDFGEASYNCANALHELKRLDEALACFDKAIQIKPGVAKVYGNRGNVLKDLKRFNEALTNYDEGISIDPEFGEAYYNRGNVLHELRRLNEALASYSKAIAIKPDFTEAYVGCGNIFSEQRRTADALASYNKAIAINPDSEIAQWNLSLFNLLHGNFRDGWQGYEWRWKNKEIGTLAPVRNFTEPLWLGEATLENKTILIHAEQGLGDTIQFCRYVSMVAEQAGKVILEVPRPLFNLLSGLTGVSEIIAQGDPLPEFDYQCPLMSLPLAFKTVLNTIPAYPRYINTDQAKVAVWKTRLGERTVPRIGIVWSGGTAYKNDHNRSLTLAQLIPHLPSHFEYISLQKEIRENDQSILASHTEIKHFGDALQDFTDTAALIELMDVIISVDTSVAHLAGAMGKRIWVLLPYSPDWRWLLGRDDSPWYPTIKLYRQNEQRDWHTVLKQVKSQLEMDYKHKPPDL